MNRSTRTLERAGCEIVGFFGRSGSTIDSLGVVFRPINDGPRTAPLEPVRAAAGVEFTQQDEVTKGGLQNRRSAVEDAIKAEQRKLAEL